MISVFVFIKNLDLKKRYQVFVLIFGMILTNFAEVLSIALIPPYLAIISDKSIINSNEYLLLIKSFLSVDDKNFLVIIGVFIFLSILLSNLFLTFITYITKKMLNSINNLLLGDLFNYYINIKFEETLLNKNSLTRITTKINNEVARFTFQVLLPFFEILKRFFAIILMLIFLFYIEPVFTFYIILFFALVVLLLYFGLSKNLHSYGKKITDHTKQKLSLVIETFSALKEVKFLGIQNILMREFHKNNINLAKVDVLAYLLINLPRYIIEVVASLLLITLLIIFILNDQDFESMIYTLSFIVVAAYKILPSLNTIIFNFGVLKSGLPAYDFIKEDLEKVRTNQISKKLNPMSINSINEIELNNLNYSYMGNNVKVLKNINLKFELENQNYFILGPSGSGKSTLIDVLCSIIQPKDLEYKINNQLLSMEQLKNLNDYISYVPQQVNFFNRTLIENITLNFNNNSDEDIKFVNELIELLELTDFINNLPNGIDSYLGEKIQNMSGGQRQRLSMARALFRKKPLLILDEATSSIDFETEKKIFNRLKALPYLKSFIAITHRSSILSENDNCIIMDKGTIKFKGKYKNFKKINN